MKKSKFLAAALAATMFTTAACGLVACGDDETVTTADNKHVVWFSADGGTLNGEEALYTDKAGFVKGTIPTAEKEDTRFRGWSITIGADESAVINFSTYKFDKDTTVHAVYKAYEVVTISYNYGAGFGTSSSAQTVNGKLASLPTPTPPMGQAFKGWYTAATGGTEVTTDTVFTQNSTIYAQYYTKNSDEYTDYCLVGDTKYELEEITLEDVAQAFTVMVNLQANDVVSFYVGGQLISAKSGDVWIGMKPSTGVKNSFTADSEGTFEFNLTLSDAPTPAWTVTGDDGTIIAIENDYYIVGKDFGNWEKCLEEYHLGTTSGSINLTVGSKPVAFKVVKAADRLGGINWGGALGIDNVAEKGSGYADTDTDSNIVLSTAGTYTISLVGGEIEITSEDVEEPVITVFVKHYYLVGDGEAYGDWAKCLEAWHIGETSGEIELTVGATPVSFKVVKCAGKTGAINWDGALGIAAVTTGKGYASTDKDKNIVLKTAGTYTIKLVGGKVEITSDLPEPEPTKEIEGYTYGAVVSTKYYLVGGFIGENFDAAHGYEMIVNSDNSAEYTVAGFTVAAGGKVKIVFGDQEYGYDNIHEQWGNKGLAETDEDGNIVFKAAGTYSIFINKTTKDIYLS